MNKYVAPSIAALGAGAILALGGTLMTATGSTDELPPYMPTENCVYSGGGWLCGPGPKITQPPMPTVPPTTEAQAPAPAEPVAPTAPEPASPEPETPAELPACS